MALPRDEFINPEVLRANRRRRPEPARPGRTQVVTEDLPKRRGFLAAHGYQLAAGMSLTFVLYLLVTSIVIPFVNTTLTHWNYGQARISQYDFDVGHGGTSHFVAEYWDSQVIVIEIPEDAPDKAKAYSARVEIKGDTQPHAVLLTTSYLRPNAVQGQPDLVAAIDGFSLPVVFYNTGSGFVQGA